ncbi:hypothetical protein GCM10022408_13690 [Hymenobacter fastidiosus]|uniref:Tetratricopeptide repeat protein n=1 Tax=Hymenobacter fastidiosus TaxID=486264 RepID=A0ABP7RX04_9BACT
MNYYVLLLALLTGLGSGTAQAQRRSKVKIKTEAAPASAASRYQPLFGGLSVAAAEGVMGPAFLPDIARSFPSRAEASRFFSTKGYEYLTEGQLDTARYRFNLAWLLDQQNPEAYRGLGIISSRQPTPDAAITLFAQGLAIAPANAGIMSDLGASYLLRYKQTRKKKDLEQGLTYLEKATAADPANATAWQQLAQGYFLREEYPKAWEAVHQGQSLNMTSIDFDFIGELQAKLPDPRGMFK